MVGTMVDPASTDETHDPEDSPVPDSGDEQDLFVVPIEESIDLHHFRPAEILAVVDAYLDAALEAGFREVRLIHGRGKGVQRANIRRFLEGDPRVERFSESSPDRGGWGATLAWLRDSDG
jgi:dsDNA-specific endonuclease/ATPase MutS2